MGVPTTKASLEDDPTTSPQAAGDETVATPREPELRGPFGRRAIRLGRIFGIQVGLDWSWLFIFLLISLSLSQWFAQGETALPPAQAWQASILASLLFFASILLHELGHSRVAQAHGLQVRSITLFVFGGLARLAGEPKTPRAEFLIAAAGPLVSILLGLAFWGLAEWSTPSAGGPGVFAIAFGWLGTVNLWLAVFNLVPGFPLDGGRLMRALVWQVSGDFERATLVASAVGAAFAYVLIGTGIFLALSLGAFLNGIWLAFIGWFLLSAAQGSSLQMFLQRELGTIRLADAMEPVQPLVPGDVDVASVLERLVLAKGGRYFFVAEDGEPVGLVTLHQIKHVLPDERAATTVRSIMIDRAGLITVPLHSSLWQAFLKMNDAGIGQLPVEHAGRIVGLLSREQMVRIIHNVEELHSGARG